MNLQSETHKASHGVVKPLPRFTTPALQYWKAIPEEIRSRLLTNVWCGHCGHETTITHFNGSIKRGELLLMGKCAQCHGDVARVIECT